MSVDLGGRRIIKKNKKKDTLEKTNSDVMVYRTCCIHVDAQLEHLPAVRAPRNCVSVVSCDILVGFFFFSSRRRHTRLQGDWSSDVCSSDLLQRAFGGSVKALVLQAMASQ